jgi:hypothetical protein
MAHLLSVEIPPIVNPKVLRIYDTTVWDSALTVTARKLDIIPPGYSSSTTFNVTSGFDRLFNASNLGISVTSNPQNLVDLLDGIYIVRLTVEDGSDSQWVEYNHLRQVCLLKKYYQALCTLNFYPCDTLDVDLEAKRKELSIIKSYIDAAKAKVEWCNAPVEGLELHRYAVKLLDRFSLEKCKNC